MQRDYDNRHIPKPKKRKINDYWDFAENTFFPKGDRTRGRAANINTLGEVPDSSWYTNRIGVRKVSRDELVRGPDAATGPAPGSWTVVAGKSQGISPGFRIKDSAGEQYFLKFDPETNPEMATSAEVISTKLFHALGYNVPENYIVEFRPEDLRVDPGATVENELGEKATLTIEQIQELLSNVARKPDGAIRAVASKLVRGENIGPFKFYGTRGDDANDVFPHENRRELRGYYVFCSWLNHDDSRSINTQDFYVTEDGRSFVKHYLIDFGSTLGSGSIFAQKRRAGNEYMWEAKPTFLSIPTLGLWLRPWVRVKYPDFPSIGRFEAAFYRPEKWKPEYPNAAFSRMDAEDAFWAARQLMRFSDEDIRAVVRTARLSDSRAEEYLAQCLIARRNKAGSHWLRQGCSLDNFAVNGGTLHFEDLLLEYGLESALPEHHARFFSFDNRTGGRVEIPGSTPVKENRVNLPAAILQAGDGSYFVVTVSHVNKHFVDVYLRRSGEGLAIIGLERK